jgi:spore maturation protein CgeB
MSKGWNIVIIGLSISSSWGNGHATTYRSLVRALAARGHEVLFLEQDAPWYASNRDLPDPPYCELGIYRDVRELFAKYEPIVANADVCMVGSYVPDGVQVSDWVTSICLGVTAFYDIDTPVTLAGLASGTTDYISQRNIADYDVYLSFTGGPTLDRLENDFGAPLARALYCSFDESHYRPIDVAKKWELGYMGTYSADRQPTLNALLVEPACQLPDLKMVVAGPQYPDTAEFPHNVERIEHLPPAGHVEFYCSQRFTLNVTRADMIAAGYSPSVRLFEAAACGVPVISDHWAGLDTFFEPGSEILIAERTEDVVDILTSASDNEAKAMGQRARRRVMASHTAAHRAEEFERSIRDANEARKRRPRQSISERTASVILSEQNPSVSRII